MKSKLRNLFIYMKCQLDNGWHFVYKHLQNIDVKNLTINILLNKMNTE